MSERSEEWEALTVNQREAARVIAREVYPSIVARSNVRYAADLAFEFAVAFVRACEEKYW